MTAGGRGIILVGECGNPIGAQWRIVLVRLRGRRALRLTILSELEIVMTQSTVRKVSALLVLLACCAIAIACAPSAAPAADTDTAAEMATATPPASDTAGDSAAATLPATTAPPAAAATEPPAPTAAPSDAQERARQRAADIAQDIPQIEGIDAWLNTDDALAIDALAAEGKVVLVDFWTYTCINCIRTLPYLREWWSRYEDDGLVILGIHTPEFEFEKDYDNVASALETHSIGWPVAQDNEMTTWRNFNNRYWPAKYLFNSRGEEIYRHFGEGDYGKTEEQIRKALVEAGADLSDDPLNLPEDQARDANFQAGRNVVTPELYAGWHRNLGVARAGRHPYVADYETYFEAIPNGDENAAGVFESAVPQRLEPHLLYFQGQWSAEPERVRHARVTEDLEDYLALNYAAKSVNAVLTSDSGEPYQVVITQDGAMLSAENAGLDIQWDENGRSYILVDEPRMYAIVDNPQYLPQSLLTMRSNSDDFGLFAFTFGVYAEGP